MRIRYFGAYTNYDITMNNYKDTYSKLTEFSIEPYPFLWLLDDMTPLE